MNKVIRFFLQNPLIATLLLIFICVWGVLVAPFDWKLGSLPRDPVPVDAIPDIGENQQIVFTPWPGRSPRDIEDQITYPLTVALLGVPGVKTVRSYSFFGYSSIYIIFKEDVEFYWSRSRVLEKLASISEGTLPAGVSPALGPDATALGQVFWYTLEGRDAEGRPTGGWSLDEMRSVQDWYVRYALQAVDGVAEVASIGGFVREYQIDVDPDALRAYKVSLAEVIDAVRKSNLDVGARTIEVNGVEYVVRGVGFIKTLADVENIAVAVREDQVPVQIKHLAKVQFGPALRRGALDKNGAEVVGGVVVVRYGENPLTTIQAVKEKIEEIYSGMPSKLLDDGRQSKLTVVPFYDRTGLIKETLGTLNAALVEEILITTIVVVVMLLHIGSSLLVSALLPIAILAAFILMKQFGIDANIVALSGIAIAIGTMVDIGIVLAESIYLGLRQAPQGQSRIETIYHSVTEVSAAVTTAVVTTIVSFLPVFALEGAEGKLFKPLAYTKTFSLIGALVVALLLIPPAALLIFRNTEGGRNTGLFDRILPQRLQPYRHWFVPGAVVALVSLLLARSWMPLGIESHWLLNFLFVILLIGGWLWLFRLFQQSYTRMLRLALAHKVFFCSIPILLVIAGALIWRGLGEEFMPDLDEGSFLYMPTTMPHASMAEALDILKKLDTAVAAIPEVESTVGKLGRVNSSLDPAPISMFENIINYKSEYILSDSGEPLNFKYDRTQGVFLRDAASQLIPDPDGRPYRQWREHIKSPDDIWDEIVRATRIPGVTSAPKLQPIAARIVMLQSGMRAPMGVKVRGPSLEAIEAAGLQIEEALKEVDLIEPATVVADRVVGKPYLEIEIDREAIGRYGLTIAKVQEVIEVAIGGTPLTMTVEGRERYPVRIRYPRELRSNLETLGSILIPTPTGLHIPLRELARISFSRRAQVIKSEDTFLTSYVVFDKKDRAAEVAVVEAAKAHLERKLDAGEIVLPEGVSYRFAGSYENQIRAQQRLMLVIPLTLFCVFLLLYLQFRSTAVTLIIFSGIFVAWSGGFLLLWLYSQEWFMNFSLLGVDLRELFQIRSFNLSVAVWVGFIALFGIATDDGVLMASYIKQKLEEYRPRSKEAVREAVIEAAERRIRPALMTTATTLLALLPVLTSRGRGADIMVPMAIPAFGGMLIAMLTVFVVPVLYAALAERDAEQES